MHRVEREGRLRVETSGHCVRALGSSRFPEGKTGDIPGTTRERGDPVRQCAMRADSVYGI